MSIRARFVCHSKKEIAGSPEPTYDIELDAVADGSPENEEFFRWTPSGSLNLQTVNPSAAEQLVPGKTYVIDITAAD